jgi:hypothetical protein
MLIAADHPFLEEIRADDIHPTVRSAVAHAQTAAGAEVWQPR